MRTPKQAAARLNGSKSCGPKTEAGKRRSSINAQRHGLLTKGVVLDIEHAENFGLLLQQHVDKLQPMDDIEFSAIEEMTACAWRLRRVWSIEKHFFDKTMDAAASHNPRTGDANDPGGRVAAAFSKLSAGPEFHLLGRYESRAHRMYQRALANFLLLRQLRDPDTSAPGPDAAAEPEPERVNKSETQFGIV